MMSLDVRYLFDHGVPVDATAPLLRWLLAAGADELTVNVMALVDVPAPVADAFEDAMAPFELPPARRRTITDGDGGDNGREVRRWRYTDESLAALRPFFAHGLFHHVPGPAGWLEDLAIYRDGQLLLGIVSHEREGVLRLEPREHAEVAALGVRSEPKARSIAY